MPVASYDVVSSLRKDENMSWFSTQYSDFRSKAEALLVKLDQDAKEVFQDQNSSLERQELIEPVISDSSAYQDEPLVRDLVQADETGTAGSAEILIEHEAELSVRKNANIDCSTRPLPDEANVQLNGGTNTDPCDTNSEDVVHATTDGNEIEKIGSADIVIVPSTPQPVNPQYSKKFTIQKSRKTSRTFMLDQGSDKQESTRGRGLGRANTIGSKDHDISLTSIGADDIRASINRSLLEYAVESTSSHNNKRGSSTAALDQTTYTSHFDSQPNLVSRNSVDDSYDLTSSRLHSSPSFKIDVPDDFSTENGIASQFLRQSALKKKSTFYLHNVINRLSNTGGRTNTIFGDETRIKLRRAQLRASSYVRRLNYYFRTYPMMKYVMFIYLVLMQLLVVYVLFFYQSSSSSSELSAQVNKQQQELNGFQSNSETSAG